MAEAAKHVADIAELGARVTSLEDATKGLGDVRATVAGLAATVGTPTKTWNGLESELDTLKTTVDGLENKLGDPEVTVADLETGLGTLKTAVAGLEAKLGGRDDVVADLKEELRAVRDRGGAEVVVPAEAPQLAERVSSIEGQVKMAKWLVPVVVVVLGVVTQLLIALLGRS